MKDPRSLFVRFYEYQKERFPFFSHGILIAAFSFSAISYSRLSRGLHDFIGIQPFLVCLFNTLTLFFLLRVFDEFKDKEDDARYRKYLPVPRGLVSLGELRNIGIAVFALQILSMLIFYPSLLLYFGGVILYLALMGKEFFVEEWLRKRQLWYNLSHMFIIPFIDIYASSYDWKLAGVGPPTGLAFFFAVSYCNGLVLEIGRKIKAPEMEEEGVVSYTKLLGKGKAIATWVGLLTATLVCAFFALRYARHPDYLYIALFLLFSLSMIPAFMFLAKPSKKTSKAMEITSGLWTIGMYLILGGIPMLL